MPESISNADISELQSFGMTFRKAEYVKDFSNKITNGEFVLSDVEVCSKEKVEVET
jgi:DNA-3-methyladenine glycosylase II